MLALKAESEKTPCLSAPYWYFLERGDNNSVIGCTSTTLKNTAVWVYR